MSVDYTANNLGTSKELNVHPTIQASGLQSGSLNTNNNSSFKLNSSSTAAASNTTTDILWRNSATGEDVAWLMNGTALRKNLSLTSVPDQNWKIVGTGDFNKDGNSDILWRNSATGQDVVWFMNGSNLTSWQELNAPIPTLDWNIVGTGDFNKDGNTDILWRNSKTGEDVEWLMNGTTLLKSQDILAVPDQSWNIVGTGDFNKDGNTDILWRNSSTGEDVEWVMNGTTISSTQNIFAVPDKNWKIVGTGDFNTDSNTDILWRNSATGEDVVWFMNGTTISSTQHIQPAIPDTNWQIVGTGNFAPSQPPVVSPGQTPGAALDIGNLISYQTSGSVGATKTDEYYKFTLANNGTFDLSMKGSTASTRVELVQDLNNNLSQDPGESFFTQPISNVGDTEKIDTVLPQGTYYVHVFDAKDIFGNFINNTTPYSISFSTNPVKDPFSESPGSDLKSAYNIGDLNGLQSFNNIVGQLKPDAYYRFTLTNNGTFHLSMKGSTASTRVELVQDLNNNLSQDPGESFFTQPISNVGDTEKIDTVLPQGTYYVHVFDAKDIFGNFINNTTPYSISFSTNPVKDPFSESPGSDLNSAYNIGDLSGTKYFYNIVGQLKPDAYYKFNFVKDSTLNLTMNQLTAPAKVELLKNSGVSLFSQTGDASNPLNNINRLLSAGTYYIHVSDVNSNTPYTISLMATP